MRVHLTRFLLPVAAAVLAAGPALADQITVFVPGTADPYLAGMPAGSTASGNAPGSPGADVAPAQSPVLVAGLPLSAGMALTVNATGSAAYGPAPASGPDHRSSGPDGILYFGSLIHHLAGPQNGLSDVRTPINALLGVFLGDSRPDLTEAPATLDFGALGTGFSTLSPALKQVFFIGDGLDATAGQQTFIVPAGATRLYLGTADGWEWANNRGGFYARVNFTPTGGVGQPASVRTPEPGACLLGLLGAGLLALPRLRRRRAL